MLDFHLFFTEEASLEYEKSPETWFTNAWIEEELGPEDSAKEQVPLGE